MAASGTYKLELDAQKRNVFVTQLNQREEEEDVQAYPVVKEAAGKLLQGGVNTLQKTLLLQKEVEVDRVDEELRAKRAEFHQRMEQCSERQVDVQKKQQKMKDRVTKFDKFIKENEAKRRRAIQKYQAEVKMREQKHLEYEQLCDQLDQLKERHEYLKNKLAKYKIYEEYLLSVVDILPAHYIEVQDSMVTSLMMRHRTLSATNESLIENLNDMTDEIENLKGHLEEMKQTHDKNKVSINSQLSQMQKAQEHGIGRNQEQEHAFFRQKAELRAKRLEYGQILMAIENIAEKCRRRMDPELEEMSRDDKLEIIKRCVVDMADVSKMSEPTTSSSPRSERRSQGHRSKSSARGGAKVGFTN